MKTINAIVATLALGAALTACDHHNNNPEGAWTMASPVSVTQEIVGATSATQTLTMDFNAPVGDTAGALTMTANYDVTFPAAETDSVASKSYQAVATIQGTWTRDVDDDDDYLLSFDKNSLSVSGIDAPELGPVTDAFLNSLARYTTIEDVEISNDGSHMTFEIQNPEMKMHFVKK